MIGINVVILQKNWEMRIKSNRIEDIVKFALSELEGIYSENEIKQLTYSLITHFCNIPKTSILANSKQTVLESELLKLNFAIKDLKKEKPLQYIIGYTDFYNIKLNLNHKVLIPRPETEELVDMIIKENKGRKDLKIADFGCGSGAIALALKKNIPESEICAFDIDDNAINQTKENAQSLNLDINIEKKDLLKDNFNDYNFDIIVSNPPYVMEKEKSLMRDNVLNHEPHQALFVKDENPLIFYQAIERIAQKNLKPKGKIYMEINESLSESTKNVFKDYDTKIIKDLFGKYRFIRAEKLA
ncbi:MAG: peptide chain release factor N(5)-glutamine methyltransferase [Bacteroidales bacterium]|jgi:release factor glutamine methyltransferase|nr:peptide chain release factor N(5)-glutamine methyltransferase [Bacteroidales bacterium]MDX9797520.1 peptide chain release factor N(5)-glutamine methyltransferase [Bacteroidales bacterium]